MQATVLEVCVGLPREIEVNGEPVLSGIFKKPVSGEVPLSLTNLHGDGQANLDKHGGRGKAAYVYSASHYPFWMDQLGRDALEPSQFGQNITVDGLPDNEVRLGDRFQLGTAIVSVAQPRIPCAKLAARIGEKDFSARFLLSGRLGYYVYVETEGSVSAGDQMQLIEKADHDVTVEALWRTVFTEDRDIDAARIAMDLPYVDSDWKKRLKRIIG